MFNITESVPRNSADVNRIIRTTAEVLRNGGVAVLPTETVYGLAACLPAAERLIKIKRRSANHPFPIAFADTAAIRHFCGELTPLAERLTRRFLPGPFSFVLDVQTENSPLYALPKEIQRAVSQSGTVCCRIPLHPFMLAVLRELDEPLILTSANRSGQRELQDTIQIAAELGEENIDMLIDGGRLPERMPSTIVKVTNNQYTILREGAVPAAVFETLSHAVILFICTGNSCRSPMAEYFCKHWLAAHYQCAIGELIQKSGFVIRSAGTAAHVSRPPSAYAVEAMKEYGIDISGHLTAPFDEFDIRFADTIFAMTGQHRSEILRRDKNAESRVMLLRADGQDIADPIGDTLDGYRKCAAEIKQHVEQRMTALMSGE